MDTRPVLWDSANRTHIGARQTKRPISPDEISEVLLVDAGRFEADLKSREAFQVIGRTLAGRWIVVIWIEEPAGRYPIHARDASIRIIRRISSASEGKS